MKKDSFFNLVIIILLAVFSFQLYISYLRYKNIDEEKVETTDNEYGLDSAKKELIFNKTKWKYSEFKKSDIEYYKLDSLSEIPIKNLIYTANDSIATVKFQRFSLDTSKTKEILFIGKIKVLGLDSTEEVLPPIAKVKNNGDSLLNSIKTTALIKYLEKEGNLKLEYMAIKKSKKELPYLDLLTSAFGFLLSLLSVMLSLYLKIDFRKIVSLFKRKRESTQNEGKKSDSKEGAKSNIAGANENGSNHSKVGVATNNETIEDGAKSWAIEIEQKLKNINSWNLSYSFEKNIINSVDKRIDLEKDFNDLQKKKLEEEDKLKKQIGELNIQVEGVNELETQIKEMKDSFSETDKFFESLKSKYAESFFKRNDGKPLSEEEFNKEVSPKIIEAGIIFMFFLKTYKVSEQRLDDKTKLLFMDWAKGKKTISELKNDKEFEILPDRATGGYLSDFHFLLNEFMKANNVNTKEFPIERYITE